MKCDNNFQTGYKSELHRRSPSFRERMLIKLGALFVSFWLLGARASSPKIEVDKRRSGTKIVGGEKSPVHYPYQLSLQIFTPGFWLFGRNTTHICGGSILSESFFLTAAHCVQNVTTSRLSVLVGTSSLSDGGKGSRHSVASCEIHPKFVATPMNSSDLALCRVEKNFVFSASVNKIDLERAVIGADANATLTGWGSTAMIRWLPIPFYSLLTYPDQLRRAFLLTMSNENCSKQTPVSDSHICTISKWGQGACAG